MEHLSLYPHSWGVEAGEDMSDDNLRCVFCGTEAAYAYFSEMGEAWWVFCDHCGARGGDHDTADEARAEWRHILLLDLACRLQSTSMAELSYANKKMREALEHCISVVDIHWQNTASGAHARTLLTVLEKAHAALAEPADDAV